MISGTIASPCLSPALAILLGYVAKVGSPLFGFATLFVFALGMGLLLIFIGTFAASISLLPRAGGWMVEVKRFFGFLLLAVCIYFLQPFLSFGLALKAYAILSLAASFYYFATSKKNKIKITVGVILAVCAVLLLIKGMKESSSWAERRSKSEKFLVKLNKEKNGK